MQSDDSSQTSKILTLLWKCPSPPWLVCLGLVDVFDVDSREENVAGADRSCYEKGGKCKGVVWGPVEERLLLLGE